MIQIPGGLFKLLFHRPDIIFDLVSADLLQFGSILFCIIMPFFCGEVFVHRNLNQNIYITLFVCKALLRVSLSMKHVEVGETLVFHFPR